MFFNKVIKHTHIEVNSTHKINVENLYNDVPEFKRVYTSNLLNGVKIKVEIKTFLGTRFKSAELTQQNGRWITFDIDNIADKIIDPVLVPLVEECCNEINRIDKEFIDTNPTEYVDEQNRTWRRVD